MSGLPFTRYLRLWRELPRSERRARTGRVLDRWLRRNRTMRSLPLLSDATADERARRALDRSAENVARAWKSPDPRRGPLAHDLAPRAAAIAKRYPDHAKGVIAQAGELLERRFSLLGSTDWRPLRADGGIDWHRDPVSGVAWDPETYYSDIAIVRRDGSDVKLVWELNRFQHLIVLGQAYQLAPHVLAGEKAESLRKRCAAELTEQLDDWWRHNPRGIGINWTCSMEVALRAMSWLAAAWLMREAEALDQSFLIRFFASLHDHGRHIRQNLEAGDGVVAGNHYLFDLLGLEALATALPELRDASDWSQLASAELPREMARQVRPDGVSFENSTHYHLLVTELFVHHLLLVRCRGEEASTVTARCLENMLEVVAACTRPDGTVPSVGDSDDGRVLPLSGYGRPPLSDARELLSLGAAVVERPELGASTDAGVEALWLLGEGADKVRGTASTSRAFSESGWYVLSSSDMHILIKCGCVGNEGEGSHDHNDRLGISLWSIGRTWVIDPGTGTYTRDPELRNRLRSTGVHATLAVEGSEQARLGDGIDGLFRMTETSRPEVVCWEEDPDRPRLVARHDGLSGDGVTRTHQREIALAVQSRKVVVTDRLVCALATDEGKEVRVGFPLAPDLRIEVVDAGEAVFRVVDDLGRAMEVAFSLANGARAEVTSAPFSPSYGVVTSAPVLSVCAPIAESFELVTTMSFTDSSDGRDR